MSPASRRSRTWKVIGLLITLLVVALMVRQLVNSWPAVTAYPWRWNVPLLLGSFVFTQLGYIMLTRSWRSVLHAIEVHLSFKTAYSIFLISNLGRYLPGKFWQIGAAAMMGRRLGLSATDIAPSLVVYQLYLLPSGAILALLGGALPPQFTEGGYRILTWAIIAVCSMAALWPHVIWRQLGRVTARIRIDADRWKIDPVSRFAIAIQCVLGWIFLSAGFGIFVLSVMPLEAVSLIDLGQIFVASYLAGYLALVAPGGLGVREGAMALLLQPHVGMGPATALALLARLWVTISELIALAPAFLWLKAGDDS